MQLTISSDEPVDRVVEAVSGLLGVRLAVVEEDGVAATGVGSDEGSSDDRVTKTRH